MQKVFNALSVVSFVGFAAIAGGIGYVFINQEAIIDAAKESAMEQISEALPGLLTGALGGSVVPDVPDLGGGGSAPSPSGFLPVPGAPLGL